MELAIILAGDTAVIALETFMVLGKTLGVGGVKIVPEIFMALVTISEVDIVVIVLEIFMGLVTILVEVGKKIVQEIGTERGIISVRDGKKNNLMCFKEYCT